MSVELIVRIMCDVPGCANSIRAQTQDVVAARAAAVTRHSWATGQERDLCPTHSVAYKKWRSRQEAGRR